MSDTVIFAISLGVTALGMLISWGLYRRRGAASGLRGAAWSLVPLAAAMTGVTGFVVDLAFSPAKWAGVAVAGLAVLLYLTSGVMLSRRSGAAGREVEPGERGASGRAAAGAGKAGSAGKAGRAPRKAVEKAPPAGLDPEMAEIEEILRNRGIK